MSSGSAQLSIAGAPKKLWFCNFSLFVTLCCCFFFFNSSNQFWSLQHTNIQRFSTSSMQSRSKGDSSWVECFEDCLRYHLFFSVLGLKGFRVLNIF
ncbi:hypothetical protein ACOSQ3_026374 [Xanthoceras sorbifolium]